MEWHIEVWLFYMNCIEVQWLNTAFITKALCHWLVPELVCQILFGVASFDNGYSLNLNIKYNKFYYTLSIFRCYHQYFLRHGPYMGVPNLTCSYSILHWAVKILIRLQTRVFFEAELYSVCHIPYVICKRMKLAAGPSLTSYIYCIW